MKMLEQKERQPYVQKTWLELAYNYILLSLKKRLKNWNITNEPIGTIIKLEDKNDKALVLEQYKTLIEGINKNNESRETLNNFWITLHGTVFAAIAYVKDMQTGNSTPKCLFIWVLWGVGIILSMVWWISLSNIKRNIDIKNEIIIQLEKFLPAKIFTTTLSVTGRRQGKNSLSSVEKIIPMLFFIGYITMALVLFVYPNIL